MKLRSDKFSSPVKLIITFSEGQALYVCNVMSFEVLEINGRIDIGYSKRRQSQRPPCQLFKGSPHVLERVWTDGGNVIGVTVKHPKEIPNRYKEIYMFLKEGVE